MDKNEKTIELVKKWFADPDSVSKEELEANREVLLFAAAAAARADDADDNCG